MGGASTQITFVPASKPTQYLFNTVLSSHSYDLYTYSYPLGLDQANREILAGLLSDNVCIINNPNNNNNNNLLIIW